MGFLSGKVCRHSVQDALQRGPDIRRVQDQPGHWRFSARTNETELDVSRHFLPFGGGGHPHAAGLILDTADVLSLIHI